MSLTSPRSSLTRLAIATAAGALVTAAATAPAVADDGWDQQDTATAGQHDGDGGGGSGGDWGSGEDHGGQQQDPRTSKGVVTARDLLLRSAPNRGSQVFRVVHRGDVVSIFCKTPGQPVQGNPLWYLLTDGTWAWGAARYIDTIGPAPRWC